MGRLAIAGLKNDRLGSLTAIDFDSDRLKLAEKYGASETICPLQEDLHVKHDEHYKGKRI